MSFDFLLDKTGDISFDKGDISLVSDTQRRVRQEIEVTLKTFTGEWFNNINFGGINKQIVYAKGSSKAEVDAWFKSVIASFPEVLEITAFQSTFSAQLREYVLEFTVLTSEGDISVKMRPDLEIAYRQLTTNIITPTCGAKSITASMAGSSTMSAFLAVFGAFGATITSNTASMTAAIDKFFATQQISNSSSMTVSMAKIITANIVNAATMVATGATRITAVPMTGTSAMSAGVFGFITAVISNTSAMTAGTAKIISANISNTSTMTVGTNRTISAIINNTSQMTVSAAGRIAANISNNTAPMTAFVGKRITANISGNTSTMVAGTAKSVTANISGNTANMTVAIAHRIASTIANTASMSAVFRKNITALIGNNTSTMTSGINTRIGATINNSGTVTASIQKIKPIAAAIAANTSNMTANIAHRITATVAGNTAAMSANIGKRVNAVISNGDTMTANIQKVKVIASTITNTSTMTAAGYTRILASITNNTAPMTAVITKFKPIGSTSSDNSSSMTAAMYFGPPIGTYDALVMSTPDVAIHLLGHENYNSVTNGTTAQRRIRSPVVENNTMEQSNTFYYADGQLYQQPGLLRSTPSYSVRGSGTDSANSLVYAMYTRPTSDDPIMTVNMWIKTPATLVDTLLFSCNDGQYPANRDDAAQLALFYTSAGRLTLRFNDNQSVGNGWAEWRGVDGQLQPNTTYMVTFRFTGGAEGSTAPGASSVALWINAASALNTIASSAFETQYLVGTANFDIGSMLIGTPINSGQFFVGHYERISMFKRALTSTEIEEMHSYGNRTDYDFAVFNHNPVSYVRFEAHTDSSYYTSALVPGTGFAISGSSGAGTFGTTALTTASRGGLTMGTTRAAQGGVILTNGNTMTVNAWVRPTSAPSALNVGTIMSISNSLDTPSLNDQPMFAVFINSARQIQVGMWTEDGAGSVVAGWSNVLNLNTNYQITVVYDYTSPTKFSLFINGIAATSSGQALDGTWSWSTNGILSTDTRFVYYGGDATNAAVNQFAGVIERVSIHSTALTQQEISTMYTEGTT